MIKSPFKFLDAYTLRDRDIFFGRDFEITDLYRKVFEGKILLVYGVSGTGKSSLINCGLASRFDESDWLPINIRRGNNITVSLNDALNKAAINPLKEHFTVNERVQSVYLDHFKPVYLIFDQFEELFIFGTTDERKEFIRVIRELVRSNSQCRIMLVIREEFLAGITEFEEELPEIFANRFRVEKMKRANAMLAVEGPCRVYNINIEAGFPEELIDRISPAGKEIELTYLQIYLDRIFRITAAEHIEGEDLNFSKDILSRSGSVSDLLGQFLEEQIRELENPEVGMAILKSFVSVQGTRKRMTETEILGSMGAFGTTIDESTLIKYLTKFVDLRILRERDEGGHFELRHDALAAKIFEKITLVEKEILEIRQFIENAYHTWENRKVYLSGDDLDYIAPYEDNLYLNKKLEQFILDSKNLIARARRRRVRIISISGILLFIVLSFLTGWALNERKKAVGQSRLAEEKRIEAVNARDDAIKAQDEANRSRQEAEIAKDEAINQKAVADSAFIVAEMHRKTSDHQRQRAEELYIDANNQRQIAQEAQKEAEQSAREVTETNRRAMYQLYLFNAKEFANKSLLMEKNDTLKALLALNAFNLVNYGFANYSESDSIVYEIVILEALQKAYGRFEPNTLQSGEIWAIESKGDMFFFSDTLGRMLITRLEEPSDDRLPRLKILKSISLPLNSFVRSLTADQNRIACGTADGDVILITDISSGEDKQEVLYKHDKSILSIRFIPDKNWLATTSLDRTIRLWDLNKNAFIAQLQVNNLMKNLVLEGNSLLCSDDKGGIFVWDLLSPETGPVLVYQNRKPFDAMAINSPHNWLAASSGGEIFLFPSVPGVNINMTPKILSVKHTGTVSNLKFSPDNRWLCSVGYDGAVMLWDMSYVSSSEIETIMPVTLDKKSMNILSCAFDGQSKYLIYGDNTTINIYPVDLITVNRKLNAKMGTRTITREEWDYYRRGDIKFKP